ncbi:MAG: hypothetical protein IIB16_02730 [Chloroflexi bacterium]|nr:hypothetical protein [Chloroflexota bacterium]
MPTFSAPTLALESGNGCVGQTIMLNIVLSDAPNGFSGFHAIVTVDDPSIATITNVQYNSLLSPTNVLTLLLTLPADEAVLFAADVGTAIQNGATDVVLATITLDVLSVGQTQLDVTLGSFGVQEEDGSIMVVDLVGGVLTVN